MGDVQLGSVTHLSSADVQALWVNNGGDPSKALTAAAIVFGSENPAGNAGLVNDTPETGDYSVGLWQINYYGGLEGPQTARFGSAADLANSPDAQARAAIAMSKNGTDWRPWGPDFGVASYAQPVSDALPGSRVANWLDRHGGGGVALNPGAKTLLLAGAILFASGAAAYTIDPEIFTGLRRMILR